LTLLYWRIGQRIHTQVLDGQRAEYGEEIIATLSRQLVWSHFVQLLTLKLPLQREYYAQMCRVERWTVCTLRARIDSMLYPLQLILQILQNSNGLNVMTGMLAAILTGDERSIKPMRKIQRDFTDCLPPLIADK